jgi:hypothetical protein
MGVPPSTHFSRLKWLFSRQRRSSHRKQLESVIGVRGRVALETWRTARLIAAVAEHEREAISARTKAARAAVLATLPSARGAYNSRGVGGGAPISLVFFRGRLTVPHFR